MIVIVPGLESRALRRARASVWSAMITRDLPGSSLNDRHQGLPRAHSVSTAINSVMQLPVILFPRELVHGRCDGSFSRYNLPNRLEVGLDHQHFLRYVEAERRVEDWKDNPVGNFERQPVHRVHAHVPKKPPCCDPTDRDDEPWPHLGQFLGQPTRARFGFLRARVPVLGWSAFDEVRDIDVAALYPGPREEVIQLLAGLSLEREPGAGFVLPWGLTDQHHSCRRRAHTPHDALLEAASVASTG